MIKKWLDIYDRHRLAFYYSAVAAVFLVSVILSYYAPIAYKYPVPAGDDIFPHLSIISSIVHGGLSSYTGGYPPGFHLIVIGVSRLLHISLESSLLYVASALLPLSGIMIWLLARRLFGPRVGFVAYVLYALVSLQPLQTFFDGSLPNLMAAGILMPAIFLCMYNALTTRRKAAWAVLALILVLALLYSHHLTAILFFAVSLGWTIAAGIVWIIRVRSLAKASVGVASFVSTVVGLGLIVGHASIFGPARVLFSKFLVLQSHFPFVHTTSTPSSYVWDAHLFGVSMGGLVFQGGVAGAVLAVAYLAKVSWRERVGSLLVVIWLSLYLTGSMNAWSGEPSRLARDLAMPASILAGFFLVRVYAWLKINYSQLSAVFAVVLLLVSFAGFRTKLETYTDYSKMVRFSAADQQAYRYLIDNGYGTHTIVLAREQAWQVIRGLRGDDTALPTISPQTPFEMATGNQCYLVGWYFPGVWPDFYTDHTVEQTYLDNPQLYQVAHFTDSNKVWYLECPI